MEVGQVVDAAEFDARVERLTGLSRYEAKWLSAHFRESFMSGGNFVRFVGAADDDATLGRALNAYMKYVGRSLVERGGREFAAADAGETGEHVDVSAAQHAPAESGSDDEGDGAESAIAADSVEEVV